MNAVGIDVSKGKSTVAIMQPLGVVVKTPYEIQHTESDLKELAVFLRALPGETKVLMEYTGRYYEPVAQYLHESGIFVSVVNAILAHDYCGNSLRRVKTDKKDAVKLANMALDRWLDLKEYVPENELRQTLKICNRQYNRYNSIRTTIRNNLIALLDQTFPGVNNLFTSTARKTDGHEKWVDFALKFWHCECVCGITPSAFKDKYFRWCRKNQYRYSDEKALDIYASACGNVGLLPKCEAMQTIITQAIIQLQNISETLALLKKEMQRLAALLPEYDTVMKIYGVGDTLGVQLMAEIGDVTRFDNKKSLVAYAGIDAPPYQSGNLNITSRSISKRGSPSLRKTLYQIIFVILLNAPQDEPVYGYLLKKRSEGKPFKVYMIAAANKFLRIYYARVKESLISKPVSEE